MSAYLSAGATFSADRLHRYRCWRTWDEGAAPLAWLMLNPSTANEWTLDPTLRRVESFSRREGAGGFEVWNLWSLRATAPRDLWAWIDVGQPDEVFAPNVPAINTELHRFPRVVCAWGDFSACPTRLRRGAADVAAAAVERLRDAGVQTLCLGRTASGQPRHPLYIRGDQPLVEHW